MNNFKNNLRNLSKQLTMILAMLGVGILLAAFGAQAAH
jgi:hypothetical protein